MPAPYYPDSQDAEIIEMIRVNHAGEYGAQRIYKGQIKSTDNANNKVLLQSMLAHEEVHLKYFQDELIKRDIRPTFLIGLWHHFGYWLGYLSAKVNIHEAMLVTSGVEEVIEQHYNSQLAQLKTIPLEQRLQSNIQNFMLEEVNHKDIADNYLTNQSPTSNFRKKIIKHICKTAILISKKF